ncbi:ECERIFERUM 1 protein [Nymphaea thermarum]|nr:ECERIFERUM 1 protein [Nymphaea thermarum]
MASHPGPLTDWPWEKLGSYKYTVLLPFIGHAAHTLYHSEPADRDYTLLCPFYLLVSRLVHDQLWISWSRFQNARSKHQIQSRGLEFQQVDRERRWDDQAIMHAIAIYLAHMLLQGASHLPLWNTKGLLFTALVHAGPVEFVYYWAHRALHHHFLFTRYHSHHHSSFVTEPITSVVHPFAEHLLYLAIFAPGFVVPWITGTGSLAALCGYMTFIDLMNNLGHCNFEFIPKWTFAIFPPLKYIMYTPTFHSLHHSQVHINFCLFMPIYDYMYGTVDKTTDSLYETSIDGREQMTDVVHLTHPTSIHSIWQIRFGFAYLAAEPYCTKWYFWLLWPFTAVLALLTWMFGATFTVEKIRLDKLKIQTWAIPRFGFQYNLAWQREPINSLIRKAIKDADAKGVKVITLGLHNQSEELNQNGKSYLDGVGNVKLVDGCSLAAAVVMNNIPQGAREVLVCGRLTKTGYAVVRALCQRGTKVLTVTEEELQGHKSKIPAELHDRLELVHYYDCKVWLVGDGLSTQVQRKAPKGTLFVPFSQFHPMAVRSDCSYHTIPAMAIPKALENVHSCENWLPRRVMSAWRIAGIVHALEGWDTHECGEKMLDMKQVFDAAISHGFRPLGVARSMQFP